MDQAIKSSREAGVDPNPDWMAPDWSDVWAQWAHVLLNGTMVWRVRYAYINRGAGMDGYLPWPHPIHDDVPGDDVGLDVRRVGWWTTRWELEFASLLNALQGNTWDFDLDSARRFGRDVHDVSPLDS